MKRNYELNAENRIVGTTAFPFDGGEPFFDFPDDFDFKNQIDYKIEDGKIAHAPVDHSAEIAEHVRAERDRLLNQCDLTYCNAANWEIMSAAEKEAWQAYKQALRDVTEQAGFPKNVEWPVRPGEEAQNGEG